MILNTAPQNEAVLSNVGQIGEFRIRNSAKAFNILSSGLYANKIRAIVRELSCNAVDSHVAAGKADVPFDVHLPNALEPHFSIRDYGTGLSHDQVTSIYTTYFESTKTSSNDFIGALGLGSKSPFSYTDNFTVTAIKDGRKGIYSAFINGEGVPSIALMMEEDTTDPAGVEVKFSVNDRYDFTRFKSEAESVYKYFKIAPNVTGASYFNIEQSVYETKDIIPGVSLLNNSNRSYAVMGNIGYPIEVPNSKETLGELAHLLECGLEMRFEIGELDFQASREGLSYIPETIAAIKRKLKSLNEALYTHLETDVGAIENDWEKATYLSLKNSYSLWRSAIVEYATKTGLRTVDSKFGRWDFLKRFRISVEDMAAKYNIHVRAFDISRGRSTCSTVKPDTEYSYDDNNVHIKKMFNRFAVGSNTLFVINDTKLGASERAKFHFKSKDVSAMVNVLEKADPTKEMDVNGFLDAIANPPAKQVYNASDLDQKPRSSGMDRNVTILHMERASSRGGRRSSDEVVWASAGSLSSFDKNVVQYYVPLTGYTIVSKFGMTCAKELQHMLKSCGIAALTGIKVYGVRKGDIESVKSMSNWINVEDHLATTLAQPDENMLMNIAMNRVRMFEFIRNRYYGGYQSSLMSLDIDEKSPYSLFMSKLLRMTKVEFDRNSYAELYKTYAPQYDTTCKVDVIVEEYNTLKTRYPLLSCITSTDESTATALAEYINFIDQSKGI